MTMVVAPILPHLAEEIHATWKGPHSGLSVFTRGWQPLVRAFRVQSVMALMYDDQSDEWDDPEVEQDMEALMSLRSVVMGLLEQARVQKCVSLTLPARH